MVSPNPYKVPCAGAGHTDKWPFYHFVGDSHDWVSVWLFRQYIYYCSRNKPDRVHSTATPPQPNNTDLYTVYICIYNTLWSKMMCPAFLSVYYIYVYATTIFLSGTASGIGCGSIRLFVKHNWTWCHCVRSRSVSCLLACFHLYCSAWTFWISLRIHSTNFGCYATLDGLIVSTVNSCNMTISV